MPSDLFRRFGWAVYLLLLALAVIIFYGQLHWTKDAAIKSLLLNISSELIVITLVFFLVNQFFQYPPEERRQKEESLIRQLETTCLSLQQQQEAQNERYNAINRNLEGINRELSEITKDTASMQRELQIVDKLLPKIGAPVVTSLVTGKAATMIATYHSAELIQDQEITDE